MNPTEKKYLRERVEKLAEAKRDQISRECRFYNKPFVKKWLKEQPKARIIQIVRKEIIEKIDVAYSGRALQTISFDPEKLFINVDYVFNEVKVEEERLETIERDRKQKLTEYMDKFLDNLMLGDAADALKKLEEFAKKVF